MNDAALPKIEDRPWHALDADAALAALGARREGLSSAEAQARRQRLGANELPRAAGPNALLIFLHQFKSPLIYLLLAAAAASILIGEARDALFIGAVLLINAAVGTGQEYQAARGAAALDALVRQLAVVLRDGEKATIDGAQLVPGDIMSLESGARIAADLRLLSSNDLRVDESLLTGESLPVEKQAGVELAPAIPLGDRVTLLHAGTTVLSGRAEGVVVRIGLATEIGRIAGALATAPAVAPPLMLRLERFTRWLGLVIVVAIAALAAVYLAQGHSFTSVFFVAVALAVSAIPEGLPVAISVALAIAARRMAEVHVIVRSLPAVEGLGACTIIASDKTGTLTVNQLTVKKLWLPAHGIIDVEGEGYSRRGQVRVPQGDTAVRDLAIAGALCNEASWHDDADGIHHVGDTVDVAFLVLAAKLGLDHTALRDAHPAAATIPFEPQRRYAARFHRAEGRIVACVKGAAEAVLPMCADADAMAHATALAAQGYRVLAVASGDVAGTEADTLRNLHLLGFVGLIDPVRPEVPAAIAQCRHAGVAVVMVTGDHPETALAIGRDLGLADKREEVVTGNALDEVAHDRMRFDAMVAHARIFARVEPTQKLEIVNALQRHGHFVAVTGDGVNDAPALRAAHIGVAMGRGGTDVARAAGDLILTDDNFASIVAGIAQGRAAYDNVRKVTLMLVSTGAAEIVLFVLAQVAGLPLPLTAVQLLWLNLVTNGIQDVALAFEKGEPMALERPPRPPDQPLFDRRMIEATILSGAVMGGLCFGCFAWLLEAGWTEAAARNILLLLMVSFENAQVLNCRSELRSVFAIPLRDNPFVVLAVLAAQAVHIAAMNLPGLRDVLGVSPVSLWVWVAVVAIAAVLVAALETYKFVRRRQAGLAYTAAA
jgi:P-type Ca2+ transporter type 2C